MSVALYDTPSHKHFLGILLKLLKYTRLNNLGSWNKLNFLVFTDILHILKTMGNNIKKKLSGIFHLIPLYKESQMPK